MKTWQRVHKKTGVVKVDIGGWAHLKGPLPRIRSNLSRGGALITEGIGVVARHPSPLACLARWGAPHLSSFRAARAESYTLRPRP